MSEAGVRGIDLFKMAGESISGWIPRWKTARATSEMSPNFRPILFGLKVRTRGPQPSICVRTFSLFTTAYLPGAKRLSTSLEEEHSTITPRGRTDQEHSSLTGGVNPNIKLVTFTTISW